MKVEEGPREEEERKLGFLGFGGCSARGRRIQIFLAGSDDFEEHRVALPNFSSYFIFKMIYGHGRASLVLVQLVPYSITQKKIEPYCMRK